METSRKAIRLTASVCLLALAACSSGGGGGGSASPTTPTVPNTPTTPTTPTVSIGAAPIPASVTMNIANPPSYNFMGNPAPNGTTFNLIQSSMDTTSTTATGHSLSSASLTLTNLGVYRLDIPDLNVHQGGLSGLNNAGTLPDGRTYTYAGLGLTYSLYAGWAVGSSGSSNFGFGVTGFQTPISGLPSGSATYTGSGATGGAGAVILTPSGTGTISIGQVSGNASVNVNFASGAVSGTLSNMTATPSTGGGASQTWNTVNLAGSLSGTNLSGTTSAASTPSGSMAFGGSSTGAFAGALFGPNAQEAGASWTLHDPSSQGKTAIGFFGTAR